MARRLPKRGKAGRFRKTPSMRKTKKTSRRRRRRR